MSVCNPCDKLKRISLCTDSIVIGTMAEADTDYIVYFRNTATDKIVFYHGTSDADALLTITPPYGFNFPQETDFEVWVTLDSVNSENNEEVQVEGWTAYMDAMYCFLVSFIQVYDGDNAENFNYTSQTLELAL